MRAPPKLIGMVGKAQSGKDTFANVLVREYGYMRLAFANELKRHVAGFLGITFKELEARKDEFRATLQAYGEHMRKTYSPNYWIRKLWICNICAFDNRTRIVITDVRYLNEADFIHEHDGVLVRRVRRGNVGLNGKQAQHSSETELEAIVEDFTCNCDTIPKIQEHARRFVSKPVGDI